MLPEQRAFTILDSTILIKTDQCGTPPIVEAFDNTVPLGLLCVSSVHQVLNMHPLYGSILFFFASRSHRLPSGYLHLFLCHVPGCEVSHLS